MQVAERSSNTYFCCPDLNRFKSSERHATLRPTPRSTPQMSSISSTELRGNCFLAALTFYGFMVTPVSACPNAPRNAVGYRPYHTNPICCVLHEGHRSAHAGYRVSHLAWPSVRALLIKTTRLLSCISSVSIKRTAQPGGGVWGRFQRRAAGRSIEALYTESGDHEPFVTCPAGYCSSML